ncbi:related to nucleoprotein TPR [Rhynchosporium secalis]|uniref:Related to nucleoprotein TPR n=1 Tax=Rhynchosporium secalis TaxID=38038 RepID=A0A1E1LV89_RHYSE|nr:related to nucleoprotein TPR [Rhynchosporium secalis]
MAAAMLDVDYLSAYLDIPHQTLTTTIDSPTAELVRSVLEAVTVKAREHDELQADKLRVDIELENSVRTSDTRIEGLRANVEKAQKTVEEVRTKLKEEENARSVLESELQTVKSSSTTSTSEVATLHARITSLEAGNRDTLAVLESKTTANDELAKDLQKQHQKGLELSQQITALQQTVQSANSAASSAKFREQSLKQEIELAKRNNEWFENELKTKSAEALKYRKEKGARIAELQRLNEDANSNLEALKKTEQALRTRVDEIQKKAEESLGKVQQLQESAAKSEEGFRQELESARRLAQLQSQQSETHKNRLREVEAALERVKDDAAVQVSRIEQALAEETQERDRVEQRNGELEAEIDRLESLLSAPRAGSVTGTPRQGLNGRSGSPAQFGTPGSVRKSVLTITQLTEDYHKLKMQYSAEKRRGDRLTAEMEEMMQGLEAKQPEIEEIQAENGRLHQEVIEMSKFVDQTGKERDRAKKDARKAESEASTAHAEASILGQQLRDLSAQIKMLLCDMEARERGFDALSPVDRAQLERLARGEVEEGALEGLTDTDRFISQRLTVFRSVSELQEKNQELLKIIRQLGAQMESEEALAAKHQAAQDHEEVQNLQAKIENYKDELQSMITRSESYIKERDMFRRMLQHRGQLPPTSDLASVFGQSIDGAGLIQSTEQGPSSRDNSILLRELQSHFDQYREEQSIDRRTMKEQQERLSHEKGALQAEVAKITSQITFVNERYSLLESNYEMLKTENGELQKRSNLLSEASAKQDLRTQQVAEDLIEAKGLVESMRNENANLKAEKKLWKDIQDRLSQDNEGLMNERSRLNTLIANQQTLQNERELSDSENRRRLNSQVENLEAELNTTKRKLNDEVEENRKAQLRKEYDAQQTQKRIDDLASSLSQVREELVAAKTTRDHLQSRVDELTIELKSAEERVVLLQPRPTPRPGTSGETTDTNGDATDGELSREQELAIEVSELKRDLDLARSELENTKSQMEQYKVISQSSEEELASFNATQDQYREEMDSIIEEKDTKIRELEQRVDDISSELTKTNNELTALRNGQSEVARHAEEEQAGLHAEIARLKDEDEKHATAAQFHQQDLRAQAAIATKAQQDYENELVKHAEAAKLLQVLRGEHNQLKTECATFKAEAESARVTLNQSQSSWEERRDQFENELKELRTRRDDLNAQNKLLHEQLENLGAQITGLQHSRSTLPESTPLESGSPTAEMSTDRNADGLRELNNYLRREKEIVEVQYELKTQEAKRLQQQLDYAQSQLDESRLKLDQERRQHTDGGRSSIAHKDLMEKLNELNLFRESSITLRSEARQAQAQLTEKSKRVEDLLEQIQPLESKIRELEQGKETLDGEMRLLQEDRDRWQKRTQDIISKYDRIDPAEMEQLKETIESLRAERDSLTEEQQPLKEKIQGLEGEKAAWQQSRTKLIEQAKERNRINLKDNKDRTAERDAAIQEKEELQQQLTGLQQQLETAVQEKETAQQQLTSLNQELEMTKSERDHALANASTTPQPPAPKPDAPQSDPALDQQLEDLRKELEQVKQQKQALETQLKDLREQLQKSNTEREVAVAEAVEAKSKQNVQVSDDAMQNGAEEGQIDETPNTGLSNEERKALEERIAAAEVKMTEAINKAAKMEEDMDSTVRVRSDRMKSALNKKLVESRDAQKAELEAEFNLKLEQEKQIWLAENKAPQPPSTPLKAIAEQLKPANAVTPAMPATPATPSQKPAEQTLANLPEAEVREFISKNPTAQSIIKHNIKNIVTKEVQKSKEEHAKESQKLIDDNAKALAEAVQKAEAAKTNAVFMESRKSALKINMAENKTRTATGKLEVVEQAVKETPQKPVVEVWEDVKAWKPPTPTPASSAPPAPAASEPVAQSNGSITTPAEVKSEATGIQPSTQPLLPIQPPQQRRESQALIASVNQNGTAVLPLSNIPNAPVNNGQRVSSIPTMRGNASIRGRGNGIYQARGGGVGAAGGGGQAGRGRGGPPQQRGGLNASASPYSPSGPTGMKRARDEGSMGGQQQGHAGKRPRGGGQN